MNARRQRLFLILGALIVFAAVVALVLKALDGNIAFYLSPSEIAAGKAPRDKAFRVGGQVRAGSLQREADGMTQRFVVTDGVRELGVLYRGILPDLFREGRGAVVQGRLNDVGLFVASEVLAKHDENYQPPAGSGPASRP